VIKQRLSLLAFLGSLLVFSGGGCTNARVVDAEKLIADEINSIPTGWQFASRNTDFANEWSTLFDDAYLQDYMRRAIQQNLDLKQFEARLRESQANLRQARSLLGPSVAANLGASGVASVSDVADTDQSFGSTVSFLWDLDVFGVNKDTARRAMAQTDVEKARLSRRVRELQAQVALTYFQIVEADQQLLIAQENLSFIAETNRVSEARFQAGDISRSDLALSELEFENARANVEIQNFATRSARRSLSVLIGGFGDDSLKVSRALPANPESGVTEYPADVLSNRHDVSAARAAVQIELENLKAVAKGNLPSFTISGRLAGSTSSLLDLFDPDVYLSSLALNIDALLYDSGRLAARTEAASSRVDAAVFAYAQTLREAVLEVNNSFDEAAALKEAFLILERARTSAEEALSLEQIRFELGEAILLDVLTVQRRVNAIKSSRINVERRMLDAQVAAFLALGDNA